MYKIGRIIRLLERMMAAVTFAKAGESTTALQLMNEDGGRKRTIARSKKKVYCIECKFIGPPYTGLDNYHCLGLDKYYCCSPKNMEKVTSRDDWLIKQHIMESLAKPNEINCNNDCPWFEPKR